MQLISPCLLLSSGIPPHEPGTQLANYTVPAVRLPNGTYIMESLLIAQAIEAMYPEPKAHLDAPILAEVMDTLRWTLRHLVPVLVPRMPRECLSGPSITYHIEARKKTFGMTLEELEEKMGGEAAWKSAMPGLAKLAGILNLSSLGPFCLGQTPSYADFLIVGFLEWCRCLGGDIFPRLMGLEPAFQNVYDACKPWLEKND